MKTEALIGVFAALIGTALFFPADAMAGSKQRRDALRGSVVACSKHGHFTCETARLASNGTLVLRGGTKLDCAGDCREALRKETVDFWDNLRETGS